MSFLPWRAPLLAAATLPLLLHANTRLQDRSINDLPDATLRAELGQLGYYPESLGRDTVVPLIAVPLRSWSPTHVEFADAGVRVRIEAQTFTDVRSVKRTADGRALEGHPIIGWTPGDVHRRLSRVELVWDGQVVELPTAAFTDLFDPHLWVPGPDAPVLFTTVSRSTDGWRIYVLAQIGEGPEARMVTWVFEDGRYLCRVVDAFRMSG